MFSRQTVNYLRCAKCILLGCSLVLIFGWQHALSGTLEGRFNETEFFSAETIGIACPQGSSVNSSDFQRRCDALVFVDGDPDPFLEETSNLEVINAIEKVGAGQSNSPGTQANKTGSGQVARAAGAVNSRMETLRVASLSGKNFASFQFYQNGEILPEQSHSDLLANQTTGGAAGDDIASRLGVWAHGMYNFGNRERTFDEIGFKFDNWGTTAGVDYLLTDNFFLGAAFSYLGTDSEFSRSGGGLDSDSYVGSIYASYNITDNFYVDGIASYGGVEYDISRNISYTISTGPAAETVNTKAKGTPDGNQYSFGFGTGYNIVMGSVSVTPLARVNYSEGSVDSYNERGGSGWAQHFSKQKFRSLTTAVGTQVSHALSIPWGVVTSQIHGEWLHQYKDSQREYATYFLGDGNRNVFKVFTGKPDRNYFVIGGGLTGTFASGMSAYINYDAIVDYNNVDSHRIILGGRIAF